MTSTVVLTALVLALSAQDGGVVLPDDRPVALRFPDGSVLFPKEAFKAQDDEFKRLQATEQLHKQEDWRTAIVIVALVACAAGLVGGISIGVATTKALDAQK